MNEPGGFAKKVDESWKEQVEKERSNAPSGPAKKPQPAQGSSPAQEEPAMGRPSSQERRQSSGAPASDFGMFLSSLSMQALIALGEMPHPVTQEAAEDLDQARYLIDVLGMLQEKTQGNLSQEESGLLDGLLYELRMKYVQRTGPQK